MHTKRILNKFILQQIILNATEYRHHQQNYRKTWPTALLLPSKGPLPGTTPLFFMARL